ncbi:PepSY domain-containing protein, partial [Oharaeibacter diazotrophicus]
GGHGGGNDDGGGRGGDDHDDDGDDHGGGGGNGRGDGIRLGHDEARAAVERGEMVPLSQVLRMIRRSGRGEPIDVELVRRRTGRVIYEVIVLDEQRHLVRLFVDAADNRILAAGGY